MLPCLEIEDWGKHFTNWGDKIFNDDQHASHYLFCYTLKPNNCTSQQVNNCEKDVTTSVLPGQQFTGNSAGVMVRIC